MNFHLKLTEVAPREVTIQAIHGQGEGAAVVGELDAYYSVYTTLSEAMAGSHESEYCVSSIFVDPRWRFKGVGSALLAGAKEHAQKLRIDVLTLQADDGCGLADNSTLPAFYRKQGMVQHDPVGAPDALHWPVDHSAAVAVPSSTYRVALYAHEMGDPVSYVSGTEIVRQGAFSVATVIADEGVERVTGQEGDDPLLKGHLRGGGVISIHLIEVDGAEPQADAKAHLAAALAWELYLRAQEAAPECVSPSL
jgi:GNAT superfamily N-acetyltransferase